MGAINAYILALHDFTDTEATIKELCKLSSVLYETLCRVILDTVVTDKNLPNVDRWLHPRVFL